MGLRDLLLLLLFTAVDDGLYFGLDGRRFWLFSLLLTLLLLLVATLFASAARSRDLFRSRFPFSSLRSYFSPRSTCGLPLVCRDLEEEGPPDDEDDLSFDDELLAVPFPPPPDADPLALELLLLLLLLLLLVVLVVVVVAVSPPGDVLRCAFGSGDTFRLDDEEEGAAAVFVIGVPNRLANSLFTGSLDLCFPDDLTTSPLLPEPITAGTELLLMLVLPTSLLVVVVAAFIVRSRLFSSKLFTKDVL